MSSASRMASCAMVMSLLAAVAADTTPLGRPMLGWSTWNGFGMTFNASLVRRTAKAMKERGLLDAGYKLLSIGGSTY